MALLPIDQKKNCDKVAAFAMFMDKRQNVAVERIQNQEMTLPFSDNKVLSEFFFTNIYRELDPGWLIKSMAWKNLLRPWKIR